MKNAYKIIVKNAQDSAKTLTHDVPAPGSFWGPLKIKAIPGARFQLVDVNTGQGPDNIRVKRVGKDLRISFEGRDTVDVMITDYYEQAGNESLVGEVDAGVLRAYVPETGDSAQMLSRLTDGARSAGMALGNAPLAAAGAAAGALVAAAGFNPLMAAPLALLGAGGGGGGGAVSDTTPPKVTGARLHSEDDTGFDNGDGITSDNTPRFLISADADAVSATVRLMNGRSYTSTIKNAKGEFVVQIPDTVNDALGNGPVTYSVVVKDAAGNESESWSGTPFVVDRQSETLDPSPLFKLTKMTQSEFDFDRDDFLTNQTKPTFEGTITNYNLATQKLLVQVVGFRGTTLDFAYVTPNATTGEWLFKPSIALAGLNDQYLLKTSLVDNAGNLLKVWDQSFGVDQVVPLIELAFNSSSTSSTWGAPVTAGSSELGHYWASSTAQKISTSYVALSDATDGGVFKIGFWDLAGNAAKTLTSADNPQTAAVDDPWVFAPDVNGVNLDKNTLVANYKTPKTFGAGALAGAFGKLQFTQGQETLLNVADAYSIDPAVNSVAAINHIVMTDGAGNDTLKLTMGDVLALGVKDSFVSNGRRQMRIDGDEGDKVSLDDLVGSSADQRWNQPTTQQLGSTNYKVYSNDFWGLDLFIKQDLQLTVL